MKRKTLLAVVVAILVMLTLVSVTAAKKPIDPGKPEAWDPTHHAVFTGDIDNTGYGSGDRLVQDTRTFIRSDYRVNDFELDYPGISLIGCPTPSDSLGYLSIRKPSRKNDLEIRHNWLAEVEGDTHTFTLLCAGGTFEEAGYAYDIDHAGDCTVTERYAGEEWEYTCQGVNFHVDIDPIP